MNVIITGATGMVGKCILLYCLNDPRIESVLCINRAPTGVTHPKLREILHQDFFELEPLKPQLNGYDACFFCLGVSSVGLDQQTYYRITYELTLHFAKTILSVNELMSFCYVSGQGTDSEMKSRLYWARVKGKTENELLALPFQSAFMFRPGLIKPMYEITLKTMPLKFLYAIVKPLFPLLLRSESLATDTDRIAEAMISAVMKGVDRSVLETKDINRIARTCTNPQK
jgi:uncharacterized protein YbjT (DUF2867 family)